MGLVSSPSGPASSTTARLTGEIKTPRGAKRALVETAIEQATGTFTVADLERSCPGVSRDRVRLVLRQLANQGLVTCLGRGPGAPWEKKGTTLKRG